jgi:hypothetical protein
MTVSYPKSESGGSKTVSYSGEVPVNIEIDVDTLPFDNSVENCKYSLDVLTGSVIGMNAAQCAAIEETAQNVSRHIIDGFFGTIKSELSQQITALDNAIKAGFGLLNEQAKAITLQKNVMENDYNRISSRYVTLFADLDAECHKRIFALDKQSFELSEKVQKDLLTENSSNTAAANLLAMQEITSSKIFLLASNLNKKSREALQTMKDYITQESTIAALIASLLTNETIKDNEKIMAPAVCVEADNIVEQALSFDVYASDFFDSGQRAEITQLAQACKNDNSVFLWKKNSEAERNALNKEFSALAEEHFVSPADENERRIYETMLSLWQKTDLLELFRN